MTDWKKTETAQEEKPLAIDATQSPTTVYERRNIAQTQRQQNDGEIRTVWEYDERELTMEEYEKMKNDLETPATILIMQTLSAMDLKIEMIGV